LNKEIMMKKLALIAAAATLFASVPAYAAIRTTTLAVKNMTCVTCGPIVKKSLSRVPGVTAVEVSTEGHTATITYDDAKTNTKALIAATTNAGYPSQVRK
jgi:periplasmic mercuric ion binding protein